MQQPIGWMPDCQGTFWVGASNGIVPSNAVHAGVDKDGGPIYAGRAWHEGDLLPAKVTPNHQCAFVCWGGEEVIKPNYEVMICTKIAWQEDSNGRVPLQAIPCGQTSDGETLYLGRCMYDGTMTVGKIHGSHGCLYIPYNGQEVSVSSYEVAISY